MIAAVVVGTFIGKHFLKKISRKAFELLFEIVLGGIGIYLIVSSVI